MKMKDIFAPFGGTVVLSATPGCYGGAGGLVDVEVTDGAREMAVLLDGAVTGEAEVPCSMLTASTKPCWNMNEAGCS